eukprot:2766656-Pleurochrysis_carterae.AAC.1
MAVEWRVQVSCPSKYFSGIFVWAPCKRKKGAVAMSSLAVCPFHCAKFRRHIKTPLDARQNAELIRPHAFTQFNLSTADADPIEH